MQTRDWALVAFSLLMQSSIGTLLIIAALSRPSGRGAHSALLAFDLPIEAAAFAGGLALLISLLHLGHPGQAWLALTNVRSSWLSREIVASVLFVVFAAVVVLQRRAGSNAPAAFAAAVVLGLMVIYAMARSYMVPAQPAWNRVLTLLTSFAGALLLGAALVITTASLDPVAARRVAFVAMVLVVAQGVFTPLYVAGLPGEPAPAISAASVGSTGAWLAAARIGAAMVAMVLLSLPISAPSAAPPSTLLSVITFAFVFSSEVVGRVLFYSGAASVRPLQDVP